MKLAEALQERADLNRSIEQLKHRLCQNAVTQEGEKPAEDPARLMKELSADIDRLEELIRRINLTNCKTESEGKSLTELIASRDCLKIRISALKDLASYASQTYNRNRPTEIKLVSTVNVEKLQKEIEGLSKELRLIDNTIQQLNWSTELL